MKQFFTFTISLFLLSSLFGQGHFEYEFGTSYDELWKSVHSKKSLKSAKVDEVTIEVRDADTKVIYHFFAGDLYKIETVKSFKKKREATSTYATFRSLAQVNRAHVSDLRRPQGNEAFIASSADSVTQVSQVEGDGKTLVFHENTSRIYGPNNSFATADR